MITPDLELIKDMIESINIRPYTVKYPVSIGAMTINEEEYRCFACCKYHAYLKFISDTKEVWNHYSARENRTPLTYDVWKDDIST